MQRFPRDRELPHTYVDDSAWYLAYPGKMVGVGLEDWEILAFRSLFQYDCKYMYASNLVASYNSVFTSCSLPWCSSKWVFSWEQVCIIM